MSLKPVLEYRGEFEYDLPSFVEQQQQTVKQETKERRIDEVFSVVFGQHYNEAFSYFSSIKRKDGTPFIDWSSMTEIVEVVNLCVTTGDAVKTYDILTKLAQQQHSMLPWDLPEMKPYYEERAEDFEYEFAKFVGIPRPDGSKCHCGGTEYIEKPKLTKSIDEEVGAEKLCAKCGSRVGNFDMKV